jgi:predicted NUDIX family phosphoesterase
MTVLEQEQVLVVPTSAFRDVGYFQGFCDQPQRYLDELLRAELMSYRPRGEMETDPTFKQLIPYVIFRYRDPQQGDRLFCYRRGSGQGEKRLHSKRSVGVGGHISSHDAGAAGHADVYQEGMRRELEEEIVISTAYQSRCVGLINDDETEVGKVHLGVVHLCDVHSPSIAAREEDIADAAFVPVRQLLADLDSFESWSRICLEALFA